MPTSMGVFQVFQHFCTVQVSCGLGQNKFLSAVFPVCFDLDLERQGQALHSKSTSITASSSISWRYSTAANSQDSSISRQKGSASLSWMPPVQRSKALLITEITALTKTPVDPPGVVTAVSPLTGEKQSGSQ